MPELFNREKDKMGWKCYKLCYRLKSPLHIGYHTLGFIQRTRTYIPGRNIWGAITEKLTELLWSDKEGPYSKMKELIKKSIIPSYFYPGLRGIIPIFPSFSDNLMDINARLSHFLVSSSGKTAITPENLTAEEGSLHEIEYINPFFQGEEIIFTGYLFLKEDFKIEENCISWDYLKSAISDLQLGGDRHYGFGKLCLDSSTEETRILFDCFQISSLSEDWPVIKTFREKTILLAHLQKEGSKNIKGDIEPLVGREWDPSKGPGHSLSKVVICWIPGSEIDGEQYFKVLEYGIWKTNG